MVLYILCLYILNTIVPVSTLHKSKVPYWNTIVWNVSLSDNHPTYTLHLLVIFERTILVLYLETLINKKKRFQETHI